MAPEGLDELSHEVVTHRPRGLDTLQGKGDGSRLGTADEDRQRAAGPFGFLKQHHGCARPEVYPHGPQMHLDHDSNLPPREPLEHRTRLGAQFSRVGDFQPGKVAVALV